MTSTGVNQQAHGRLRIAVDIGGTFTDLAAFDESGNRLIFAKTLSTPDSLVQGARAAIDGAALSLEQTYLFLHGSTIAINTLLERTGSRTALVTTAGFRDIYEIGRINRPDAYNLFFHKHEPLIKRSWRFEVRERVLADGSVCERLDEDGLRELTRALKDKEVEAVAILLLHSYRNPAHERRAAEIIRGELPQAFVSASHEISREYREFERTSTVAANAYIGRRVNAYLGEIEEHLATRRFGGNFYVIQSNGGLYPVAHARQECVRMLESGPAAGVIGARAICGLLGLQDAIAFDMGGTTAKAGVVSGGEPLTTNSALIGHYGSALPIQIPMLDIFEVGAGGGSIAHLMEGNALRVGPRSAGAVPGPACYARNGNEPTVTDANLLLGRLDADHFLGGEMQLSVAAAELAMRARIAAPLGLDVYGAADGILSIAVTIMSHAVKAVTTERGLDAAKFTMIVYGGAGPLHACDVARELGIQRVLIPVSPGHFAAYGMLFSDLRHDYVQSCFEKLAAVSFDVLETLYGEMETQGRAALVESALRPQEIRIVRQADMRYVGQEHAVTVVLPVELFAHQDRAAIKVAFDELHLQRYGTHAPEEPVELVNLRLSVVGVIAKPPQQRLDGGGEAPSADSLRVIKPVYFHQRGGFIPTPVYRRTRLLPGQCVSGPALIEEHASTTVVGPDDRLVVDQFGNLNISIGSIGAHSGK